MTALPSFNPFRAAFILGTIVPVAGCSASLSSDEGGGNFHQPNDPSEQGAMPGSQGANPGSNIALGGSQDVGLFREQLRAGQVPSLASLDAAGFFAEHHTVLPPPTCGNRVCLSPMLAVMHNLVDGEAQAMLHVALNSPIEADPGARPPLSLAVVVDVSGSMEGEKIAFVRDGLEMLVDGMKDGDQLSLITYADAARTVVPMTQVGPNRVALRSSVRSLVAAGATNLSAGLESGYREVLDNLDVERQNRVILLSDGQPTAGIQSTTGILTLSRGYNSDGVGLSTIGLGSDVNIQLMRGLAQQADGNFYFLENAGAVDEVFTEELSFFLVPVARDLEVRVSTGSDYVFGRAYGSPFWSNSGGGGLLSVPSVFIAHRDSDDDVTDTGGRRGGGSNLLVEFMPNPAAPDSAESTVATVELSFQDPTLRETITESIDIRYPFPANQTEVRGFFQGHDEAAVQKAFVMLNIFIGMERAVTAFHGRTADGSTMGMLECLIAAVEDYNAEVFDKDIAADLVLLTLLRDNLLRAGVPRSTRVVARDPWPAD